MSAVKGEKDEISGTYPWTGIVEGDDSTDSTFGLAQTREAADSSVFAAYRHPPRERSHRCDSCTVQSSRVIAVKAGELVAG